MRIIKYLVLSFLTLNLAPQMALSMDESYEVLLGQKENYIRKLKEEVKRLEQETESLSDVQEKLAATMAGQEKPPVAVVDSSGSYPSFISYLGFSKQRIDHLKDISLLVGLNVLVIIDPLLVSLGEVLSIFINA